MTQTLQTGADPQATPECRIDLRDGWVYDQAGNQIDRWTPEEMATLKARLAEGEWLDEAQVRARIEALTAR